MSSLDVSAFKKISIEDGAIISAFAHNSQRRGCELNFCNMFNWSQSYDYRWQIYKERLIVILLHGDEILFPAGEFFPPRELAEISDAIRATGHRGRIFDVPEEYIEQFPEISEYFGVIHSRASWDYIYLTENLHLLSGRKLRKKRNHISQFERQYSNWHVLPVTSGNVRDCESFLESFYKGVELSEMLEEDYLAISTALKFMSGTGIEGLALYVNNTVAAMALFSRQTEDTWTIHFEKADKDVIGASQVINRETAAYLKGRCKYINREQDLGIDGLRHAKESYEPAFMLKRFILERRR